MHHHFKELKRAMELSQHVYSVTQYFPAEERYGLKSQLCRCAVSIASNIAEGSGRESDKDFFRFLNMAMGSCYELETQILLSKRLDFVSEKDSEKLQIQIRELQKMLYTFKKRIQSQITGT